MFNLGRGLFQALDRHSLVHRNVVAFRLPNVHLLAAHAPNVPQQ